MASTHICLACRRRLVQARQKFQYQPRATFLSFRTPQTSTNKPAQVEDGKVETPKLKIQKDVPERKTIDADFKKPPWTRTKRSPGDALQTLFEQSLVPPTNPPPEKSTFELYKHAEQLQKMLAQNSSMTDCFKYFVQHVADGSLWEGTKPQPLPPYLMSQSMQLLERLQKARLRDIKSTSIPSFTEVSRVYMGMGLLSGGTWLWMIVSLLEHSCLLRHRPIHDFEAEERLIADIIGLWNVGCRQNVEMRDLAPQSSELDWSHLPPISSKGAERVLVNRGPTIMMSILIPRFPKHKFLNNFPSTLIATYGLLTDPSMAASPHILNAKPFLDVTATLLGVPGLDVLNTLDLENGFHDIKRFAKSQWGEIRERALQSKPTLENQYSSYSQMENIATERSKQTFGFISNRLHAALKQKNPHQVEEIWSDVMKWPTSNPSNPSSRRGIIDVALCNYFIMCFMGLGQPNRAIDVWNYMVQIGLTPRIHSWGAMLSGCKVGGNWRSLEQVWSKMLLSGAQPDVVCWITRISGLMECKKTEFGIKALDEMGRIWLEAARIKHPKMPLPQLQLIDDVEGAVKPTIACVNAAVVGLIRQDMTKMALQILAWGKNFGIMPNATTYNIFLRPLIRNRRSQEAADLLQQMHTAGIKPDVATFTTILDEVFDNIEEHTADEQQEMINMIFAEMEQADVEANIRTYGRIIYKLLEIPQANMNTVNGVLDRMVKKGFEPSIYIYTTLMEYYFQQNPPNLDAARSTIDRATRTVGLDRVFWDKVVSNYAAIGETGAALKVLGRLASEKTRVGWASLTELVKALVSNQEWDLAKAVVRDARADSDLSLLDYSKQTVSQMEFWHLAERLNLFQDD